MISSALDSIGKFTDKDKELFAEVVIYKSVKKDAYLLRAGEITRSIYYCEKGAAVQYKFKDEIDMNVIDLHVQGDWILNHKSFSSQSPSESYIQAITDMNFFELKLATLHQLITLSPAFFQLGKLIDLSAARVVFFDNDMDPMEKYRFVLDHRPQLLQEFPLKMIASFLKITPETLSRVRERISKSNTRMGFQ